MQLQTSCGEGPGFSIWLTYCELLFKRRHSQPVHWCSRTGAKMAMQRAWRFPCPPSWILEYILHAVGGKREPKSKLSIVRNMVSPSVSLSRESQAQARPIDWRVKDGRESESRVVMTRIGVGTSLHAKAGRLLPGLSSRERLAKL